MPFASVTDGKGNLAVAARQSAHALQKAGASHAKGHGLGVVAIDAGHRWRGPCRKYLVIPWYDMA